MDCNGGVFIIVCEASDRPAVRCSDWLGGRRCIMPSVLRNPKFFTSAFLRERERVLQVVVCTPVALKRVDIKSSVRVFLDLECASAV